MDTTLSLSSPSTLLSSLSHKKPSSILRREFLGSGHNLRPPGASAATHSLRSFRKCKKHLNSRTGSSRFCVKAASLDPNSALFVVTAAAVSIALVGQLNNRKQNSIAVLVSPNTVLLQIAKDVVIRMIDFLGDLQTVTSSKGSEDADKRIEVTSDVSVDKNSQTEEIILTCEDSLLTIKSESPPVSSDVFCGMLEGSGEAEISIPSPVLLESVAVQPLVFGTELSKVQLEKPDHVSDNSTFPALRVQTNSNDVLVPTGNASALLDERRNANFGQSYVALRQPARDEVYTFYGTNQSVVKPLSSLSDVNPLSSYSSRLDQNGFVSLKKNREQKKVHVAADSSRVTAEHVEVKIPLASHRGGSLSKRKDLERGKGNLRDKERCHDTRNRNSSVQGNNVAYVNDKDPHLEVERSYNRLLRDGRLADSVEFLEDMDKKGFLDMNKIYHGRFFQLCKSQKAVKEAFHFIELIPSPTLSTFNMLMSVCANSQDSEGAFQVLQLVRQCGLKADCKLYTTLISTCAKSGKVDAMFEVFHEMVNAGVEPNVHTYGALIDGCARARQVAKAFGAYGIMRSKNVKPDRVVFNALITACGQTGAVDRAFDVLAEMRAETHPIDPDHVTVGALIKACANAGQVDRAKEVYKMMDEYNIMGTPEVYTIALNCCSQAADWEFACKVYGDMLNKEVIPDEIFLSALIDVAGHTGKLDAAFEIVREARKGIKLGIVPYSSLMGACCNAKNWQMALELYEDIKSIKLHPTISTMNALITALCDGDQLQKALEILSEMKRVDLCPNTITYSILMVASERKDDIEVGLKLFSEAKQDGVAPNLTMCSCIVGMCLRRFEKACKLGKPILSLNSGLARIDNKWTSVALMAYRETISARVVPTEEVVSLVLACLRLPYDTSLKTRLVENLGISADTSGRSSLCSLIDGFGEYDPRAFSLVEEAASLGIVPCVSFKDTPTVVDARKLHIHTAEVYLLTLLKGLKYRLAAGTKLPTISILLPVEKAQVQSPKGEKSINLSGRVSQALAAMLRRLGLPFQGSESYGKIRINGLSLRRWLQPKLSSPFGGLPGLSSSQLLLGKGISHQQRNIRTGNLSLE